MDKLTYGLEDIKDMFGVGKSTGYAICRSIEATVGAISLKPYRFTKAQIDAWIAKYGRPYR